ncbi:hypothetical protein JCM17960_10860 [Magnetospira thiophila]
MSQVSQKPSLGPLWLRCKVCWYITTRVFLAIVAVELLILIPSYLKYETDWLGTLAEKGQSVCSALLAARRDPTPEAILRDLDIARPGTVILGAELFDRELRSLGTIGTPPTTLERLGEDRQALDESRKFFDVWVGDSDDGSPWTVVLRLDAADLDTALSHYVIRVAGLVLIIALFVTVVTMLVLTRAVLQPLLWLRQRLQAVGDNPEQADRLADLKIRGDEIGDLQRAFNNMIGRIAADIGIIRSTEIQLRQARDHLEEKVVERTRELSHEISQRRHAMELLESSEKQLIQKANFDDLTGLPNRVLAMDRLNQALSLGRRHGQKVALLMMDMDNFKTINDTLGHEFGDRLLIEISQRIGHCLRDSDTVARFIEDIHSERDAPDTVARIGGDEFMVILPRIEDSLDADTVARKILNACTTPFDIDAHEIFISTSIGITLFPQDGDSAVALMANADNALYEAKRIGRNGLCFFRAEMNQRVQARHEIESRLRYALDRQELSLHFQPLIHIASGEITAFEVLLRWTNPDLGAVGPDVFIPVAEGTGLILPIGDWVLHEACMASARIGAALGRPLRAAINVSVRQFRGGAIVPSVERALADSGLSPHQLDLEITESLLIEDSDETSRLLRHFRQQGIRISIDDFGTGYSSLSYLKSFPVDSLKMDKSFVNGLTRDEEDRALARAVLAMAHSLGLEVIAEGIEDSAQLAFLRDHACDMGQGYLYSRPVPEAEFIRFASRRVAS